jgi:hypothetical protein
VDASPSRTRGGRFENRAYAETRSRHSLRKPLDRDIPGKHLKDAPSRKLRDPLPASAIARIKLIEIAVSSEVRTSR